MDVKVTTRFKFLLTTILSLAGGIIIYLVDSSKGWDDTGITAALLFLFTFIIGFVYQKKLWLWPLLTGIWIPIAGIINSGSFLFILILLIPFAGSYAGGILRKVIKQS